jgi:hypothetical protein
VVFSWHKKNSTGGKNRMVRKVVGTIRKIDGTPWATDVIFRLFPGSYDLEAQYPGQRSQVRSNALGQFEVMLWANLPGLEVAHYECVIERDRFTFDLPAGTDDVNIGDLRAASNPLPQPEVPPSFQPVERDVRQSDLTTDEIVIMHPVKTQPVAVSVSNNLDQEVQPTNVVFISDRAVRVSLEGYTPIVGTWRIRVL